MDTKQRYYMFGYGSILYSACRAETDRGETSKVIPVVVRSLQRCWSVDTDWDITTLGIKKEKDARVNGILVAISNESFDAYRKRESHYTPYFLHEKDIEFLADTADRADIKEAFCWLSPVITPPREEFPIVQSYLDVVLRGCMEVDEMLGNKNDEFVGEFLATTKGWQGPWVNDRANPSYIRALDYNTVKPAVIERIDALLAGMLSENKRQETIPPAMKYMKKA